MLDQWKSEMRMTSEIRQESYSSQNIWYLDIKQALLMMLVVFIFN